MDEIQNGEIESPEATPPEPLVADEVEQAAEPVVEDEAGAEDVTEDVEPGDADALSLPEEAPQSHHFAPEAQENLKTLAAIGRDEGVTTEDLQVLTDTFYSYESTFEGEQLDPLDPDFDDRLDGVLRRHWAGEYQANLDAAGKVYRSLSAKTQRALVDSGALASPSVLSILAQMGRGLTKLSPKEADAAMKMLRKESPALQDPAHPNRRALLQQYRILAHLASRKGKSDLETLKSDAKAAKVKPSAATKELDTRLADLRLHPGYRDKKHSAHEEVWREYWGLMQKRWPGVHNSGSDY